MIFENKDSKYILVVPNKVNSSANYLWGIGYIVDFFKNNEGKDCIIAYHPDFDNQRMNLDVLIMQKHSLLENAFIKYLGNEYITSIDSNGKEIPNKIDYYNTSESINYFILNDLVFSFLPMKRYFYPKDKSSFKQGMVVELFNNNKWQEKIIENVDDDFDNFLKLFISHNKVRIEDL